MPRAVQTASFANAFLSRTSAPCQGQWVTPVRSPCRRCIQVFTASPVLLPRNELSGRRLQVMTRSAVGTAGFRDDPGWRARLVAAAIVLGPTLLAAGPKRALKALPAELPAIEIVARALRRYGL
jgi:hypothetical protein